MVSHLNFLVEKARTEISLEFSIDSAFVARAREACQDYTIAASMLRKEKHMCYAALFA